MCIGAGIPAIVCRCAEQTTKGDMWRTIGLCDWLFDRDVEADKKKVAPAVLALAQDPPPPPQKPPKPARSSKNTNATPWPSSPGRSDKPT